VLDNHNGLIPQGRRRLPLNPRLEGGGHEAERAPSGNQLDSAILNAYLWTESKRNLPPLDAFSGLFYAQNGFAAGAPPRTPLGSLQRFPDSLAGGEPHELHPALSPLGLELQPFRPSVSTLFLFYETITGPQQVFQGASLRLAPALSFPLVKLPLSNVLDIVLLYSVNVM